ncbi:MAG TPA: M20/M25/M40 family metallo-hydrolase [Burkholderiaceae bacterium]
MKDSKILLAWLAAGFLISAAYAAPTQETDAKPPEVAASLKKISAESMLANIKVLASDEFEGRAPGGKGEALTVAYIRREFMKLGLAPGNPDGTFVQKVPMVGLTSKPTLRLIAGKRAADLRFSEDFVAWSPLAQKEVRVDKSELVFVGYGVVAPEYGWDDYKGVDMHGKTLVMLINDPPIPDPQDPTHLDPHMFKGEEMTYYGRWTYKYEMAAKLGAAAAIIVHETKPAAYPYEVVRHSWARENFSLDTGAPNTNFPSAPGWMQLDVAKEMFQAAGLDFEKLKQAALSKDFKPVALGITATFDVRNAIKKVQSQNVVARIEGSDPVLKKETVIYSAHWDHLGIDTSLPGPRTKQIFHGALDNASGVATLLELAKAYKALPIAPKRTILFIATTAEEQGLLGAEYYASHPLYPLDKTLIDINIDGVNFYGRTKDLRVIGAGKSDTDELVAREAVLQGREAHPDDRPELGGFYRADQFEFAKVGVPSVYLKGGSKVIGKSDSYGRDMLSEYIAHRYHSVADSYQQDWDFSGAVEDTQLLFMIGYDIAQGSKYPQWNAGAEFHRK